MGIIGSFLMGFIVFPALCSILFRDSTAEWTEE